MFTRGTILVNWSPENLSRIKKNRLCGEGRVHTGASQEKQKEVSPIL